MPLLESPSSSLWRLPSFHPPACAWGRVPRPYSPRAPCVPPPHPFYRGINPSPPSPPRLFCPFVTRGCRPSAVFLPARPSALLRSPLPFFDPSPDLPLVFFPITRPGVAAGGGRVCCVRVRFEFAVRRDSHWTATNARDPAFPRAISWRRYV